MLQFLGLFFFYSPQAAPIPPLPTLRNRPRRLRGRSGRPIGSRRNARVIGRTPAGRPKRLPEGSGPSHREPAGGANKKNNNKDNNKRNATRTTRRQHNKEKNKNNTAIKHQELQT